MKLTRKLILALVVAIVGVMAADAYLQLGREIALFEDDMAQDERAMGEAIRTAVESVGATAGVDAARATVDHIRTKENRVDLRWVWREDTPLPADAWSKLAGGEEVHVVREDARGERQFTYVPLTIPGTRPAALELSEPLGPQRAFLRRSELHVLLTLAAMVFLAATLALGLGMAFVGRPLRALADQARRIGGGDFTHRLDVAQRDEIGDLARELNAMCDQLVEAQARVRAEMEARIATLDQLRHADRLKTVGQLASGIAHELGTPLNVVGGRAKLILSGSLDDAEISGSARVIAEQADRMTAIIRQLLDFARRRSTRASAVDLRDVVHRTVEMVTILARARRVHVDVVLPDHALPLRADASQLQQALANILVNGVQAMPQGGTLHVSAGPRPGTTGQVFIVVQDDGIGIAPEHLPRLFEPFFTTKDVGEGTGLGLAVAHGIITEHGGSIAVTSAPGRGSRFEIVLDAASAVPQHAEAV